MQISRVASHEGYIRNLQRYLRDGDYCDDFWGEHQQNKVTVESYHYDLSSRRNTKRSVGHWYPDIGCVWTREMEENDNDNGKIIQFPNKMKVNKDVKITDTAIKLHTDLKFAEHLTEGLVVNMIT